MTAQTTKSRPQEDKLSKEYRDALLQEARRVSPTDMPQALLDLKEAALRFLDCTHGHKEIYTRADALMQIKRDISDLSRLEDVDAGIFAAIQKLKADGGCQQIITSLATALAADSRKNRDAILDECSTTMEALSAQVRGQVESDFLRFNTSLSADDVKAVFNNQAHKKSGQLQNIEDVISKFKQVLLKDYAQLALELALVIDRSSNVFKEGISESTALPKLRKMIKEASGALPDLPERDRSVSLTRFSDPDILEQYILDKRYNDYEDNQQWSQLLSNEISSWSSERLMATSKELLRSRPNDTELRDTVRSLVVMRMGLDSDMVQLADNFHDRWSIKSEVARLDLSLKDYEKDSCDADQLAGRERIMKGKKRELIDLIKKYVGEDITIDVRVSVEEGKWVYNPKDEPLKILRAAIDEKISSTQARIEALERIRKQQFTSEEALVKYAEKNTSDADLAEFKRTIQTFLDCGIYRGGDQAKEKMVKWFNRGLESINNPVDDQTNETSVREEEDDTSDLEKDFLRQDFEIDYDALELESDTTGPANLYDLAFDIRETFLTTLEDCLTDDLQGESAVTEPLKGLVAGIIRDNIKAFIELGTDDAGMLAIDLAQAISHIVKDAEMSSTTETQDLSDALTSAQLLPIKATEDFKARVTDFNAEREPQLESLPDEIADQQDAQTSDSAEDLGHDKPEGGEPDESLNDSVDLTSRLQTILNNCLEHDTRPTELANKSDTFIKAVADILHYGFYHTGHIMRDIDSSLIKKFSGIQDKKLLDQALSLLSKNDILSSHRKRSGPISYRLSPRGTYDNSCSKELREFIDAIRDLRNHAKIN